MCPTATGSQFKILDSSLELSITASQTISSPLTQKRRLLQYCSVTKPTPVQKPVQVQHGNADCEVFAVAFATAHAQEETLLS